QRRSRSRLPRRQGRRTEHARRPGHEGNSWPGERRPGPDLAPRGARQAPVTSPRNIRRRSTGRDPIIRQAMQSLRTGNFIKWFYLGMHIKRWLALTLVGVAIMGLGFGYVLREVYVQYTFPSEVYYLTLQFMPRFLRAALFI